MPPAKEQRRRLSQLLAVHRLGDTTAPANFIAGSHYVEHLLAEIQRMVL